MRKGVADDNIYRIKRDGAVGGKKPGLEIMEDLHLFSVFPPPKIKLGRKAGEQSRGTTWSLLV